MKAMDAKEYLKEYKKRLDPILKEYFKEKISKARKTDPLAGQAVKMISDFTLASGKRIRPALMYYAFKSANQEEGGEEEIIKASMSVELTHSFLLIHDDIIDRDEKRHGVNTVHKNYRNMAKKYFPNAESEHFGNSMAMIVGDIAASMSNEILFESNFPEKRILESLTQLQKIVYKTIPGEMLDVVMEARGKTTEEEILRMHEGKTANYTFEGPLFLGATLGGESSPDFFKNASDYSMAVGKAFQIRDDVLGVFGDEKKLGKPVGSDIIEGKQTLLYIKAKEKASNSQKTKLNKIFGKKDLSRKELEEFQKIIKETGSLEYSEKLADKFSEQALKSLEKTKISNQECYDFLKQIAIYISKREY
ncbi:MAG: polyprenyl synthetase family protein [Candidatus Moranbacteria bacterium]|nr:polyprenyl synthetase family protein [Candidatus Moranbacteria bacterium]